MKTREAMVATLLGLLWAGTSTATQRIAILRDAAGEEHRVTNLRTKEHSCPAVSIDTGNYGLIIPIASLVSLTRTGQSVTISTGSAPVPEFKAVYASSDLKEASVVGDLNANDLRGDTPFGVTEFDATILSLYFESRPILNEVRGCEQPPVGDFSGVLSFTDGSSLTVLGLRRRSVRFDHNWVPLPKEVNIVDTEFPFRAGAVFLRVPFERIAIIEFSPIRPGEGGRDRTVTVTLRTGDRREGVSDSFRGFEGNLQGFRVFVSTYHVHRLRSLAIPAPAQ